MPDRSPAIHHPASLAALAAAILAVGSPALADLPRAPEGFEVRLVASVPAVEYPCQVATGPTGALFVAEDPMDQVGPYEAAHGRILRFGSPGAEPTLFADGINAVFGMAWHDDMLYVMHMPYLSTFRDRDGDGVAEERDDLYRDLGPSPLPGKLNDHLVSGIQFGMDGWLYIAVGDKGVPGATRPEDGAKVVLKGGGVLRCRPDGTELEIHTSGTRNHLEPNLDALDRLFTYDNTDDGDGWWTRVTHQIDGGYYGYPYDYHDHPERFLDRMAEYGGGSPCGAVFYREDAWPERYRGLGYWAEWGKGKVQAFRFAPKGAGFEVAEPIDFLVPAPGDDFHPIDLTLSFNGKTLYVADWNMGGWGKAEKVGRVFAVTWTGADPEPTPRGADSDPIAAQFKALAHPAYSERMRAQGFFERRGRDAIVDVQSAILNPETNPIARRHLIWTLDAIAGGTPEATVPLADLLDDPSAEVRSQAARALGLRRTPHPAAIEGLTRLVSDPDPVARLEALIALGRIGDPKTIAAILPALAEPDPLLSYSARIALRRIGDWAEAANGLDSADAAVRDGLLLAMEGQYDREAVHALIRHAQNPARDPAERARALSYASAAHRESEPWDGTWWGTRPTHGDPPAKVIDWDGTAAILAAIRGGLAADVPAVRLAAIAASADVPDPQSPPILMTRLEVDPDPEVRAAAAVVLGKLQYGPALPALTAALLNDETPVTVRDAVLSALESIGSEAANAELVRLLESGGLPIDRQTRVISALGRAQFKPAIPTLLAGLDNPDPAVRSTATEALGAIGVVDEVAPRVRALLVDEDLEVRKSAIAAVAALGDREAVAPLLKLADVDATEFDATMALAKVADARAVRVYLRGLTSRSPELRTAAAEALAAIREEAAPVLNLLADRKELAPSALPELRKIFRQRRPIRRWRVLGPLPADSAPLIAPDGSIDLSRPMPGLDDRSVNWELVRAGDRGRIDLDARFGGEARAAFGYAELRIDEPREAEFLVGSDDTLIIWLNGREVYRFEGTRGFEPAKDSFRADLVGGANRIVVKCGNDAAGWAYSVEVSEPAEYAFLNVAPDPGGFDPEVYKAFALDLHGDPSKGRDLFNDLRGLACVKCHKVAGQGGSVGPELSGIATKYKPEDLIESVLYPSAKIFSGYEPLIVATDDGRVLNGIVQSDDARALVLRDAEDQSISIPPSEIEERRFADVSLMPNGLAEGISKEEFADLIAFLRTLQEQGQ